MHFELSYTQREMHKISVAAAADPWIILRILDYIENPSIAKFPAYSYL